MLIKALLLHRWVDRLLRVRLRPITSSQYQPSSQETKQSCSRAIHRPDNAAILHAPALRREMDKVMKDNRVLLLLGSRTGTSSKERNATQSRLIPSHTSRGALRNVFELNCLDDASRSFLKIFTLEAEAQLRLQVDWRAGTKAMQFTCVCKSHFCC